MSLSRLSVVFTVALAVTFTACPPQLPTPDAGERPEGIKPTSADRCAGGCASNQVCDVARRTCVDGCAPLATSITAGDKVFAGNWLEGTASSARLDADLFNGGLCDARLGDDAAGKIVLCQRGNVPFSTKAQIVRDAGGVGIIIYNSEELSFSGTIFGTSTLVGATVSKAYGEELLAEVGQPIVLTARPPQDTPAGCDGGYCAANSTGFECVANAVSCNGQVCEAGQVACIAGECSCLSSLSGALDTCQAVGKWCNGKTCANPRAMEECNPANLNATCATGHTCQQVFTRIALCLRDCQSDNQCDRGDMCFPGFGCLPLAMAANGGECEQNVPDLDGGFTATRRTVPIANTCLVKAASIVNQEINVTVTDPVGAGTGNCTYTIVKFWADGVYPYPVCRPPGAALEGEACRLDYLPTSTATQCGTGLQCVATKGGDEGVCLRACNAQPPAFGYPPTPECNTDESCVNTLRYTDPNSNSVLGVCMKKCDVFSATSNTCADVGTTPASCVPTQASGELAVSLDGTGICVPQRAQVGQPNGACTETDSFKGAACGNAQLCSAVGEQGAAVCTPVCDVGCNPPDGGTGPAECATRPNARCGAGKTCTKVTSTLGARVGFCL